MFWPLANSSRFIEITSPVPQESTFEVPASSFFLNMNKVETSFFYQIEFVNLVNENKSWIVGFHLMFVMGSFGFKLMDCD